MGALSIIIFIAIYFRLIFGLNFQDIFPIKYDIIKVRTNKEIRSYTDRVAVLDFIGLVERFKGYTAEEHNVTTSDGYNLKLHRISGGPLSPKAEGKDVVYLQHGMITSSDSFVLLGPKNDLAFLLVDAGYDVWLGNARGNSYSRSHVFLSTRSKKFWDFSWHEIGTIDIPTSIDYVLNLTNQRQLVYIGHSMGTTASYVLLSKKPEYNTKFSLVISLAPIAFWNRNKLPVLLRLGVENFKALQNFSEKNYYFEIVPQSSFLINAVRVFCSNKYQPYEEKPCSQVLKQFLPILDLSRSNISYTDVLQYVPAGASIKTIYHYIQNAGDAEFQEYDYGVLANLKRYSTKIPPKYNLSLVTAPVALYYGAKDYFGPSAELILKLKSKLPNVVYFEEVPQKMFNHADFIVANDVRQLLYEPILQLIQTQKMESSQYFFNN